MHIKINELLSSTRWSMGYIILIPVVVCIFVIWNASQRINEFESAHYRIAESTVTIVANEISKRIKNQQRLLTIFAKNEEELIHRLSASPNNELLKSKLEKKIAESFPDYFAVSVADLAGIPIIDDFDDLVGDLCLEDLKRHADGHVQPIRIHPNLQAYHIDIVVPWKHMEGTKHGLENEKKGGLLFVSFKPNFLFELLALSSTPRHELMLINRNIKNLIEITEKGPRINLKRDDFRLTEEEQQRKLYSIPVKNTAWNLTDFREASLFSAYRKSVINFSLMIILLFIMGSIFMVVQLFRAEKIRINTAKIKEEMFSLFNHDLRAPLTSIYGYLEVITTSSFCEKHVEKCRHLGQRAFDNSVTMLGIIDDILDTQKMESGGMSFEFAEVDIVSMVKEAVEMSIQYGSLHNVQLKMIDEGNTIFVKVDARRIQQAITNLLSNAIKYSPEHETVTVKVNKTHSEVIISVADNGPGIEKDFQDLVFEKFAQSKSKLTRSVGGTGLGLAIVKYIVDAHKGFVTFNTSATKGTTFNIRLPDQL